MRIPVAILVLAMGATAGAEAPPTERVRDCTAGGCHATTMDHKVLHGPTAVAACSMCHEYADPAKHTFILKRQGRELCDFCHIDKVGTEGPVVHDPVAKGQCLSCHNPHGADDRGLLRKAALSQLCADCHKETLKGSHMHTPAAEGKCTDCHSPHTASQPGLLSMPGRELCLSCHSSVEYQIESSPFAHAPVLRDCLECHTAHASDAPDQLKAAPRALCSSCHQQQELIATSATHRHSPVLNDRACLNCHTPHGGERAGLMPENTAALCLNCHKDPIMGPGGKIKVGGVPELAVKAFIPHGPVAEGDCAACHDVHGGDQAKLLTATYAKPFYQKFDVQAYALCFKCHSEKLAQSQTTDTDTGFRDGTRSLHYLHVAKDAVGRSCRACHSVHASKTSCQIAESVRFGEWQIPLNYTKTDDGGSCSPGCHKTATYDRERQASATRPPPRGPVP